MKRIILTLINRISALTKLLSARKAQKTTSNLLIFLVAALAFPAIVLAGIIVPARILQVDGDVMFRSPDAEEWLPAAVNTPLDEGDAIWTPDGSRTGIQLADGTVVRLDGGSQLDLIAVEDGFTHLHLASGRLYLRTSPNEKKDSLQIDADDTTVLPDARTRLRIDMLSNSQEDVSIFKGSAYVEGNGTRTNVRAGEHIALEEGHSELLQLNSPDNWENWNSELDRSESRAATAESNLPDELRPFSRELDSYGRWVRVPEYGMVWRLTVILSDDWAPYQSGRWIWKENDYVWISYENWGWAPYHYGRWAVVSGFGWCWVPPVRGDIYWGPGYVGWYRTGSHVGWTPLAPGETFYGHRNYGRHSVNVANTPVSTAAVVYKNRDARGGFSVLLQNDFLRGRSVFQKPSNSTAISVSVSLGSPRIQPLRETRMPIIKQTPPRVAPPTIQHQDSRELQARFPRLAPPAEKQRRPQPPVVTTTPAASTAIIRPAAPPISRQNDDGRIRTTPPQPSLNNSGHRDQSPLPGQKDKQIPLDASTHQGEVSGQGIKPREMKQKKIWKVTTTEQGNDKNLKENESKERKGKK
jgi:hypothetical protein